MEVISIGSRAWKWQALQRRSSSHVASSGLSRGCFGLWLPDLLVYRRDGRAGNCCVDGIVKLVGVVYWWI